MLITTFPAYGNGDQDVQTIKPDTVTVKVIGTNADSRFEPKEVQVRPGDTVRFEVVEGMHTVTAYHPDNRRELNIPPNAESFDSGILSAGDTWFLTIKQAGEYNYFCMPHERMGHIGKIISNKTTLKPTIYNN
ncbi:MAG: plastocyanin/azurin family copper-binding protein [Rhodohalobacter sp.]|nr:plastocyanin/azurin family copper-binding protein [Rhodohalobacter sp.]